MPNLESKATKITLVIRKNIYIEANYLNAFCEQYLKRYAWIKHEHDISTKDMKEEGVHYHIVGELKERTRLGTFLNKVCYHFSAYYQEFDSPFGIEVDSAKVIEACYQYLLHKNDVDKTPHKLEEIVTNIPLEEFKTIIEYDFKDLSINADRLEVVLRNNIRFDENSLRVVVNYFGIIREVGLGRINAISWSLNAGIKQIKYELLTARGLPIPQEW